MINNLKNYQRKAVDQLIELFEQYLHGTNANIVFKSPTGSGKTFMISALIEEFIEDHEDEDFCFIWASIGKGELHRQSFNSVKKYLGASTKCTLLDSVYSLTKEIIDKHEVVFVNWEKLFQKDESSGDWTNKLMKEREDKNFIEVLESTREKQRKIILVVDESHIGYSYESRINEIKEKIIKADITLEMSATPLSDNLSVVVDIEDVIDEGMIKKEIIVNEGIKEDEVSNNVLDSELLILTKSYEKRLQLLEKYREINSDVNPLVLIQIPNTVAGDIKIDVVKRFLREKGITEENGKLRFWLADSANFDKNLIKKKNDITEFLVFKTAVATGWDCPRAQILVKFREGKSETFEIQTIGRILRTPEVKSYDINILDNAYIYTNIKSFETKKDSYNPNKIKTAISYLCSGENKDSIYDQTRLVSFYHSRAGNYNDATSEFESYFEKEFMDFFNFTEEDKRKKYTENTKKFVEKNLNLNPETDDNLLEETEIDVKKVDSKLKVKNDLVTVKMSDSDIKIMFDKIVKENLSGLAYKRSKNKVGTTIQSTFEKFYKGGYADNKKISKIQSIVVQNNEIFSKIIREATHKFRLEFEKRRGGKWEKSKFLIQEKEFYSLFTHKELDISKSLYQPLYVLKKNDNGKANQLEEEFIKEINKSEQVKWIWENGAEHKKTNFGIPYNNEMKTFQPDFIIKFCNGWVGIFDTKRIGDMVDNTTDKALALNKYLLEINKDRAKDLKVIGGIVVKSNNTFYYHTGENYKDYKESKDGWKPFNNLLETIERECNKK